MSTLDDVRARHAAEIRMLYADDALIVAKEQGTVTDEIKDEVREARRAFRVLREAEVQDVDDADGVAEPATVESAVADGRKG